MIALMRVVPLLVFSLSAVSAQDSVLEIWQREQVRGAGRSALRPLVNLQDYVYYSQLYNSDIEAALWGWKAAIDDVKTARSWSDPHVALGHFLRPIETRDGPQQQRFSVAQAIPWPSELDARSRVALAVADAERWRYEERRADVALQSGPTRGLVRGDHTGIWARVQLLRRDRPGGRRSCPKRGLHPPNDGCRGSAGLQHLGRHRLDP